MKLFVVIGGVNGKSGGSTLPPRLPTRGAKLTRKEVFVVMKWMRIVWEWGQNRVGAETGFDVSHWTVSANKFITSIRIDRVTNDATSRSPQ